MIGDRKSQGVIDRVAEVGRQLEEFKGAQLFGSSDTVTYRNESDNQWDIDQTITYSPGQTGDTQFYVITFTADNQNAPFVSLGFTALIGNSTPYTVARVANANIFHYLNVYNVTTLGDNQIQWILEVATYATNTNVKIKIEVFATDTGEIEVAPW